MDWRKSAREAFSVGLDDTVTNEVVTTGAWASMRCGGPRLNVLQYEVEVL